MSDSLVADTMSIAERELKKPMTMESSTWIRTADGSIQEAEREVAIVCPTIRQKMESGLGSSKKNPVTLPQRFEPTTLSLVIHYCRFHVGCHSCQECKTFDENFLQMDAKSLFELLDLAYYLQVEGLVDSTQKAMAEKIRDKSAEEICHMLKLTKDLSEAEKSELRESCNLDLRTKLSKKLFFKRRELLVKTVDRMKDFVTGVKPGQEEDTREVDDLVSFINGDGDNQGGKTSKKKKNHKKRKEQKKTSSSGAAASTKASSSKKVIEKTDEDIKASGSANTSSSSSDTVDLLGTQDEKEAETTRLVEAFARSLNLGPAQIYGDPETDFSCINDKTILQLREARKRLPDLSKKNDPMLWDIIKKEEAKVERLIKKIEIYLETKKSFLCGEIKQY